MPNTLKIKRGTAATIPQGQLAEPLFTTDTYDLYIGKGAGGNQRIQNYIASGTSSQFLKGDGSLDSTTYQTALSFSSPLVNTSGTISIPAATGSVNGYLTSTDWTTFNSKEPAITAGTNLQYYRGDKTFQTLDTAAVPENGAIYFTEPRVRATVLTGLNLSGGGTIAATDSILTAFGKVQNQISALVGGATYQGTWNASTNTPTLASGTGTKGYYYIVSVNGSTDLDGITDWKVGDWAIFNGTTWDKVDNTDAVSSVNGFTGAVNLGLGNISDVTLSSPTNAQLLRFNGTSSKWENWTPTYISGNQNITLSGDVSGSGATSITTTIGALKVTNAMLAGSIDYAKMDGTTVPTWNQNTTGSAATLTTARTLTIGATGKTFDGSANVSWSLAEIGAEPTLTKGNLTETTSSVLTITGGTGAIIGSGTTIAVASAGAAQNGVVTTGTQTFAGAKTFSSGILITNTGISATLNGNLKVGQTTDDTERYITIGENRTANGPAYIDLIGDTTYNDYGFRIIRTLVGETGANTTSLITHRGTGDLIIGATEAATIKLQTNSTDRLVIDGSGNIKINNYTTNGFVKTSNSDGTFSIDTNTYLTANQTITLSGDISGSGTTAITTTIGALKVTNAMLAGSIAASKLVGTDISTVGTITAGTWNGNTIAVAYGGTGVTSFTAGQILYGNGTSAISSESNLFWDATNDRLGIGTNNTIQKITIATNVSTSNPEYILFNDLSNISTWTPGLVFGGFKWRTSDTSGIGAHEIAEIRVENSVTATTPDAEMVFSTGAQNATPIERMRITAGGSVIIGNGSTAAAPALGILRSTNGSGTDITGAELRIQGGRGTGTGIGGPITFYTAPAGGTTGSTLNTGQLRLTISATGAATFTSSVSSPGVAINSTPTSLGTTQSWIRYLNTGADFYVGVESSTNGGFFTGSTAYDSVLYSNTAQNFIIGGISRLRITTTGAATFSSSVTAAGATFSGTTAVASAAATSQMRIDRSGAVARLQNYDNGSSANISLAWDGGNVGIGTTSPTAKLHVQTTSGTNTFFSSGDTTTGAADTGPINYFLIHDGAAIRDMSFIKGGKENGTSGNYSGYLSFGTRANGGNTTERMRITSDGFVGIGNTPKTFNGTSARALQVGTSWIGTFAASSTFGTILGNNVYYNSDWKRTLAQPVSFIQFNEDNIYFANAATGTADSTFTPSTRLAITSGGKVGIGLTDPSRLFQVKEAGTSTSGDVMAVRNDNTTSGAFINFIAGGANAPSIGAKGNDIIFTADGYAGAERMRITSGGELLINTTTDSGAYYLQVNGSVYATAYYESSDIRLKDVLTNSYSENFSAIEFMWKDKRDDKKHWGYAAQDVMKYIPDAIEVNNDGMMTVNYNEAHTWKIAQLEAKIVELEAKLK